MRKSILLFLLMLLPACGTCPCKDKAQALIYPAAPRGGDADTFFNTKVPDPYHWLEDADSVESQKWAAAENEITQNYLAGPARDNLRAEFKRIWNYPKYTVPHREGDWYFFEKNDGLQNQDVVYRVDHVGGKPVLVIDPNGLSSDGTVALETQVYSRDGKLLAYGLSTSGSDRQEIHVREVETGKDLADVIRFTKFTGIGWKRDNSGFFYNRFPEPGTVPAEDENNFCKVYFHRLGTRQTDDTLVLERSDDKTLQSFPYVTDDGNYLVVSINKGTAPENRVWVMPLSGEGEGKFVKLLDTPDASYAVIDNVGGTFYVQTNLDAPRGKIVAIDLANPARGNWKTVIPEGADAIASVVTANNQFVVTFLHDAYNVVKIFNLDGGFDRDLPLPAFGTVSITGSRRDYTELFLGFTSYASPFSIYRYDFGTHALSVYHKSEIKTDLSGFETRQIFAESKDGTKIPVFVTGRKGMKMDGKNPVLLTAYGGFDVDTTPGFDIPIAVWLEHGGIYAEAIIRGGGEYGETWHQAGMLLNKQNSFDDFEAVGAYLIEHGYTSNKRLAIQGASNGGLLTAVCMLQRPELYGAVIAEVPVTDMLRYKKFAAGTGWIPEYGDAEESEGMFRYLLGYSPLHNVRLNVDYPAVLVTTADSDDRVDPSHAKKFVARLQAAQEESRKGVWENPVLLRIETKAGHGDGKPTEKIIEEEADLYAFLFKVLEIPAGVK